MLKWRLLLGTAIILALIGLCGLDAQSDVPAGSKLVPLGLPGAVLMPVVLIVAALATQEILRLARAANLHPAAAPVYIGNLLLVVAPWLPELNLFVLHKHKAGEEFAYLPHEDLIHAASQSASWALALAVIMVFIAGMRRYQRPGGSLANIAAGVFCLVYVGLMLSFAVEMRIFWGVGAAAAWIISVKMGDIGAYTIGRLFGTRRMAPTISPGKTVEGAMGAIAFACIGSWISFHGIPGVKIPALGLVEFHGTNLPWIVGWVPFRGVVQMAPPSMNFSSGVPGGWLIFGLAMSVAGMLGDLAESLLKRDVGVKDSSSWMPGFGGVLDILDALLLSAPIAWLCWALGIVGTGQGM